MAFLGVEHSLTGRHWVGPSPEIQRSRDWLAQQTDLPEALCSVIARFGTTPEEVQGYLAPKLRDLLPDPRSLIDMEAAATRLLAAISKRQRIAVFADYDVDGASSAALLWIWLRDMDPTLERRATIYIPDRIEEGYGPNAAAMRKLARDHDLIICVDCGMHAHGAIEAADGTEVIIVDHHLGGETLPPALAVVNPNRQDETGEQAHLCAAGVVFLLLVEMRRQLRILGETGPDPLALLDLVALATVADVVPLTGVNRALVRQGLTVMSWRRHAGLVALADVSRLNRAPDVHALGFLLGPRINAGGRIGQADLGARLLVETDQEKAQSLARELDRLNTERREIERNVRAAAFAQAEARGLDGPLVWAAGDHWHPGVVGIVAARLREATNRPAVVIGFTGDTGKGSGRSIPGINLGMPVHQLVREGLLLKGGGHSVAAGLTVARSELEPAMTRLGTLLDRQGAGTGGPHSLRIDGLLDPGGVTRALVERLDEAGPYGQGNPAPRFAMPSLAVKYARRAGELHLSLVLENNDGKRLKAIAFGAFETELGNALLRHTGTRFHVAGQLEINHFKGRATVTLRLADAARA